VAGSLDPKKLGELGIIRALRRRAGRSVGAWRQGIGDDAALLRARAGHELAVTTDVLVEDVHFRFRTTDPRSLGHKSLGVNLSDLGAMGARPVGFLLGLALPGDTPAARLGGFVDGLLAEARASDCPLVGGDTVRGTSWVVTVTAFGEVSTGCALLRSGARPGDRLVVTGTLGGAALGLAILEGGTSPPGARPFTSRQIRPRPPFRLGRSLAARGIASAAIDLSDGLTSDLGHLVRESGVGADVDLDRLPLARGFPAVCKGLGLDPISLALYGGEDYELLFTLRRDAPPVTKLARALGVRLTEIGVIRRGRGIRYQRGGRPEDVPGAPFAHFSPRGRIKASDLLAE
jgi:thiamine-monophosphate kinase